MNYNFYADKSDKIEILEYLFRETDLEIYDSYSEYGQEICTYSTVEAIGEKYNLKDGGKFAVRFQLWSPRHKGQPIFNRINLDPKRCNGHSFRYSTEGWGLIQLNFGGILNKELNQSNIGHFNEAGALGRESANSINGRVDSWDWKEIASTSRKLKYHLHNKLAIRKIRSIGVLSGAEKLASEGIKLFWVAAFFLIEFNAH